MLYIIHEKEITFQLAYFHQLFAIKFVVGLKTDLRYYSKGGVERQVK